MKKMLMQVINENSGEKETDSVIELKKLRSTIPKTVKLRENFNITTRDQHINNTVIPYNTNPNTTI